MINTSQARKTLYLKIYLLKPFHLKYDMFNEGEIFWLCYAKVEKG